VLKGSLNVDHGIYIPGDGDSSVTKRLLEVLPYGPNVLIEKIVSQPSTA